VVDKIHRLDDDVDIERKRWSVEHGVLNLRETRWVGGLFYC